MMDNNDERDGTSVVGLANPTYEDGSTDNLHEKPQVNPYAEIDYPPKTTTTFTGNGPAKPSRPRPTTLTVPLNDTQKRPGAGRPTSEPPKPPFTINNGVPPVDDRTRQSTYSDYSEISDIIPPKFRGGIGGGGERRSDMYDEIPMARTNTDASIASSTVTRRNQLYASTQNVVEPRKDEMTSQKKGGSVQFCQCVFIMFIGLVAVGALVLVFLLMFGIVRIQQGAEDGLDPDTGASTGSSAHTQISNLNKQIALIQANLTKLELTDSAVTILRQRVNNQNLLIAELRENLTKNENVIQSLNASVTTFSMRRGERGPIGIRGPQGPAGSPAVFNSSLCTFHTESSRGTATSEVKAIVPVPLPKDVYVTNLSCSFENKDTQSPDLPVTGVLLEEHTRRDGETTYRCICKGVDNFQLECRIHYWQCPV